MLVYARSKNRPYSLGPFPLETLSRDISVLEIETNRPKRAPAEDDLPSGMLAHAVRDANGRAYNRTAHLPARRQMMQRWADYLDELKSGARIIDIGRRA